MIKRLIALLLLSALLAALTLPVGAAQAIRLDTSDEETPPPEPIPTAQTGFDPIWPADTSYEISCLYYYQTGREHSCRYTYRNGIDIAGEGNALAVEDGVVEVVDYLYNSYGNFIVLLHDNGGRSIYAHLARTYVQEGQRVEQGDIIAKIGTSGNSAGVHLHYEYSLADPWLTFYKDKYYDRLYYEQNCLYNNERYNDSKLICQWLTEHFVQDEEYFYWNGVTPDMEQVDSAYPVPFWATLLTQEAISGCEWIGGNEICRIEPGTECLVEAIYESGWCRVLLRWEEAKMGYLTVYVPTESFLDPSCTPLPHRALSDMPAWSDGSSTTATVSAGTIFTEVGNQDGLIQVIAEVEPGVSRLLWLAHTGDDLRDVSIGTDFRATLSDQAEETILALNGTELTMTEALSVQSAAWSFLYQGDGWYLISELLSGQYLTAQADGTLTVSDDADADGTRWMLCGTDSHAVLLRSTDHRVLCMQEDGSLSLRTYNDSIQQRFCLDADMIYQLCYDGNGASAYRATQSGLAYQTVVTVSDTIPEPICYTLHLDSGNETADTRTYTPVFTGWNARQNGSGSTYHAGDTIQILGPTRLYAQWEPLLLGSLPSPERKGYRFDGWATADGLRMTDTSVLTHSMTLYAQWTPVTPLNVWLLLAFILGGLFLLLVLLLLFYQIQKRKNAARRARRAARHRHISC